MEKVAASTFYGSQGPSTNTRISDKLAKKFGPTDFVRVLNVDDEPFSWQYLDPGRESFEFTPDPMKVTYRGEPEVYTLQPGESQVILGGNAYVMIEALVKKLMAKRTIDRQPNMEKGHARNFNFSDDAVQEELIKEIYLGKERPQFKEVSKPSTKEVDQDLGLEDEAPIRPVSKK